MFTSHVGELILHLCNPPNDPSLSELLLKLDILIPGRVTLVKGASIHNPTNHKSKRPWPHWDASPSIHVPTKCASEPGFQGDQFNLPTTSLFGKAWDIPTDNKTLQAARCFSQTGTINTISNVPRFLLWFSTYFFSKLGTKPTLQDEMTGKRTSNLIRHELLLDWAKFRSLIDLFPVVHASFQCCVSTACLTGTLHPI